VTWSVVATCIVCAILLPALGNLVDASTKRRQVFFYGSILTGVWTVFGSILGSNYVWAVALLFTSLTAVTYEVAYLGLGPYLPEIATTDESRNKVSGLRQMGSTAAQLGFAVLTGIPSLFLAAVPMAILGNVVCCLWIFLCAPMAYKALRDRPASSERGNPYAALAKTLKEAKRYPHCFRFLLMHAFSGSAVGSVITQMQTYAAAQGFPADQILILVVVILIFAPISAAAYSFCLNKISPKKHQLFINVLFIAFIIYFSLALQPDSLVLGIVGAVIVGIGFGLFYSLNMANFMKVVPAAHKSEFVGLMGFFGFAFRFVPAAVYGAIVEATNSHAYAFMSIGIWNVLAFLICLTIDFEKGEKDAQAGSNMVINAKIDYIPDPATGPANEVR
jgi:MFS-type transporter involved in bile tolerance (Atg22 family)